MIDSEIKMTAVQSEKLQIGDRVEFVNSDVVLLRFKQGDRAIVWQVNNDGSVRVEKVCSVSKFMNVLPDQIRKV